MSVKKQLASFARYYRCISEQVVKDIWRLGKQQLIIGALAAVSIAILQIRYGMIHNEFKRSSILAIVYPYLAIVAVALIFHALRAPWILDERRRAQIEALELETRGKQNAKDEKTRRRFLREELSDLMKEGKRIQWNMLTHVPQAHQDYKTWRETAIQFLTEQPEFDRSHLARFDSDQIEAIKDFITRLED